MSEYVVKVLEVSPVTHDVRRYVVEKPAGYDFISGQATDVSINLPDWRNELRPFTFTCLREETYLEFTIKSYPDRQGVTNMLGHIQAGAELILHDVFGAIQYAGPGVFIAGGAGITPFISIFRDLHRKKQLHGNKLIYSSKTTRDVILEHELEEMLKDNFIKCFTREKVKGHYDGRIDQNFLMKIIGAVEEEKFYVCGPDEFVKNINKLLLKLGAKAETVVFEK